MGTKWMIEYNGPDRTYPKWWKDIDWTTNPYEAKQFNSYEEAYEWVGGHPFFGHEDALPTEHIFMSPVSTEEKLN